MKAFAYHKFGSPDVLKMEEVEKPVPKDNELLIKVRAASVNAYDLHYLKAEPFMIRFMDAGFLRPKNKILGVDVAGQVEAVGSNVEQFQPDDNVFGDISDCGCGGFAEYICASEDALVPKPDNMTFEEAATLPMASVTALKALRDIGHIQEGQRVLIKVHQVVWVHLQCRLQNPLKRTSQLFAVHGRWIPYAHSEQTM